MCKRPRRALQDNRHTYDEMMCLGQKPRGLRLRTGTDAKKGDGPKLTDVGCAAELSIPASGAEVPTDGCLS
jgi:hypothetical protein